MMHERQPGAELGTAHLHPVSADNTRGMMQEAVRDLRPFDMRRSAKFGPTQLGSKLRTPLEAVDWSDGRCRVTGYWATTGATSP